MASNTPEVLTVGELIRQLPRHPNDYKVQFGEEDLTFYRVQDRGGIAQIEFSEVVTIIDSPLEIQPSDRVSLAYGGLLTAARRVIWPTIRPSAKPMPHATRWPSQSCLACHHSPKLLVAQLHVEWMV